MKPQKPPKQKVLHDAVSEGNSANKLDRELFFPKVSNPRSKRPTIARFHDPQ